MSIRQKNLEEIKLFGKTKDHQTGASAGKLQNVFFYGLYMVPELLTQKGVVPRNPRKASLEGFKLRIGNKATLLRDQDGIAHGMVYSLSDDELYSLYQGAGLVEYAAETVMVDVDGEPIPAVCCNLICPPEDFESNPEYVDKLKAAMGLLGLPQPQA